MKFQRWRVDDNKEIAFADDKGDWVKYSDVKHLEKDYEEEFNPDETGSSTPMQRLVIYKAMEYLNKELVQLSILALNKVYTRLDDITYTDALAIIQYSNKQAAQNVSNAGVA